MISSCPTVKYYEQSQSFSLVRQVDIWAHWGTSVFLSGQFYDIPMSVKLLVQRKINSNLAVNQIWKQKKSDDPFIFLAAYWNQMISFGSKFHIVVLFFFFCLKGDILSQDSFFWKNVFLKQKEKGCRISIPSCTVLSNYRRNLDFWTGLKD